MAGMTGPPQGTLKYMTPYAIADDPPTPKPIPDLAHPDVSPGERAVKRFSLSGKRAIGMYIFPGRHLIDFRSHRRSPRFGYRLCSCYA